MNCPKCQAENRDGIKFCELCGAKMELECPNCKAKIPLGKKFCGDCGHNLTVPSELTRKELSFDEKLEKIQKYLPAGITEKILSQRDKIEGERKQVTVMFCDMKGFTPLAAKLGPEEMYGMMDHVYEILIHKVHDYEGTVNEMTGDGVMALFGAPIALEDAPQRAIRSAMAIHREVTRFNEKVKQEKRDIPPLKMRVGIHTGPVVVGTLGNDLRVEFKAVGDTVNLASRMESLAEPGTTYVSDDTFKLTEGLFRFEALGEKEIKGKDKPLKVYQVIAPSSRRTRFDVSAERGLTPFVGRERELELLLDGFERSKEGRGQAISIISDAGIGKSRLLYEFRKTVTNEYVTFLEGRCLSYSRNVAYHPVVDVLKANFDIQDNDTDQEIREKVTAGLKVLKVDEASTLPYLLELLSVKESGIEKIPMSPEARKDRTLEALKRIVLKGSELRPLIMAIEDLHWMDRSSEDAFRGLLGNISGSKIFLIFTYRPEFVHTWSSRSYHSQVTLNKLSNRESLTMLSYLLKTEDVDKNLQEIVLEKTEGIPFFIEEFIKSLKDLRIIECRNGSFQIIQDLRTVAIPSTIHDVIMARVDSLPEATRELLRTASAIEREFSHELIKRVTGPPEQELLSHLSTLKDSELLYERGIYPNSTYIFKHALTREVIYDSILSRTKKQLHNLIADAIEQIYKSNLDEHYGSLTKHYIAGESFAKGAEYAKLAAKRAAKKVALNDAIAYTKERVKAIEQLPRGDDTEKMLIDARTGLGNYYSSALLPIPAREAVEPILPLALKHSNKRRLAQIYAILGSYYYSNEEDLPKGLDYLDKAMKIGVEVNDLMAIMTANHALGHIHADNCEFDKAVPHLNRALEIAQFANALFGIAIMKSCLALTVYNKQGNTELAFANSLDGIRSAEESGDVYSKSEAYTAHGYSFYTKGFLDEAQDCLIKASTLSESIGHYAMCYFSNFYLGDTLFAEENYENAKECYNKSIESMIVNGHFPSWRNMIRIASARVDIINGAQERNFDEFRKYVRENRLKIFEGWGRYYLANALMLTGESGMDEAESWIKEAIDADSRNLMMWNLARDYALHANWFKKKGAIQEAKDQLTKAIDIFKECGADGWVTRTEKTLSEIS
jgi:class 3 adenylate cyclase/tetratricopeptide (TPR) repeat protein